MSTKSANPTGNSFGLLAVDILTTLGFPIWIYRQ